MIKYLLIVLVLLCIPLQGRTQVCSRAGQFEWNGGTGQLRWCNGYNWVSSAISTLTSCSGTTAGTLNALGADMRFCDGVFWRSVKGTILDSCVGFTAGQLLWDNQRRLLKYCDGAFWYMLFNAGTPTLGSLSVNGGATTTSLNNLNVTLSASGGDGASSVTHFCLKYSTAGVPSAPSVSDSCWIPVNMPSPGIPPQPSISFSNFYFSIGFTPGTYNIYAWVKTGADKISLLTGAGGTSGLDRTSIAFDPGSPPVVINAFATNSNTPSIPATTADLMIPAGGDVFIKWKLTDVQGLQPMPVDLFYTTDEINYTLIASGLANGVNGACSIDVTHSTGCYRWVSGSPTSSYYRVRVRATDSDNLSVVASAPPNNTVPFQIIAGSTDPGLGGSAAGAVLFPNVPYSVLGSAAGCFVVRDNGMMFLCDERGLMQVDPQNGNYKLYLPYTGTRTLGPIATATLKAKPIKIALDYNEGMLIYDQDRILRVNFATGQLTSFIGGGSFQTDGTFAGSFNLTPVTGNVAGTLFTPLPNGDLWFQTNDDFYQLRQNTRARIYRASDDKIYSLSFSGTGSLEDASFNPDGYAVYNIGISFNPLTSTVTRLRSRAIIPTPGGHSPRSTNYSPITGALVTPHIPFLGYWTDDNTITSRNGDMYAVDRFQMNGVYRYNSGTNSWDRIIGTGVKGQCVDGTPALSCNVEVTDAFINSQNKIFFVDRNRIRTLDDAGNVISLFGQPLTFGDGGLATSARLNKVLFIGLSAAGRVALIDDNEFVIREFIPGGTINRLAGDGADAVANTSTPAIDQPVSVKYWGASYNMATDPSTGDIYYTRGGGVLSRLNRSTGYWQDIAGTGGTSYISADGLLGNQLALNGYGQGPLGFNGSKLLFHTYQWSGSYPFNSLMKLYGSVNGEQFPFAGYLPDMGGSIDDCSDGTLLSACALPPNHNHISTAQWDSANGRWLLHANGSNRIRTAVPGGSWGTLATLPRGVGSYTYVVKSSVPYVYYCGGGRVYRYNINSSTETALFWPSSSLVCSGWSIIWHPSRQSVIFPVQQNGLGAIAEIFDI